MFRTQSSKDIWIYGTVTLNARLLLLSVLSLSDALARCRTIFKLYALIHQVAVLPSVSRKLVKDTVTRNL